MAQVKDVIDRLNHAESRITRMNTRKVKLDEMLQIGRPTGVKTGLGYVGEKNIEHVMSKRGNLEGVF